MRIFVTESQR